MKPRINIAIDGYSSCGKSTLAKALAKELNYIYVDSGAMYRAVSLYALQNNLFKSEVFDKEGLVNIIDSMYITFKYNSKTQHSDVYLNGSNVELEIRSIQVSNHVSQVSDVREIRSKLVHQQKRMAASKGVVMDGRDIGTVVLPDAEIKFFMTADKKIRAQRRFKELISKGMNITLEQVSENINMRDHIDSHRKADPLRQADDALILDNTNVTMDEQFEFALNQINQAQNEIEKKSLETAQSLDQ